MNESILTSVKKINGLPETYEAFDADMIMHINTVLMILTQMGIGPASGFTIESDKETWSDFLGEELKQLAGIKSYVAFRVRLMFDTPQNQATVNALNETVKDLEYRLYISQNPKNTFTAEPVNDAYEEEED